MKVRPSESKKSRIRDENDGVVTWLMDVGGALDEETLAATTCAFRRPAIWSLVVRSVVGEGTKVWGQEREDETKVRRKDLG